MFKFIKQYAEQIKGVDVYPIVSLILFFVFFMVLLAFVKRMGKERANELSNLPLDNDTEELSNSTL